MSDVENNDQLAQNDQLPTYHGSVVWFSGSFGFIEWQKDGEQQRDIFVYWTDIAGMEGKYKTLLKGQRVSFQIGTNNRGQPKAISVLVL